MGKISMALERAEKERKKRRKVRKYVAKTYDDSGINPRVVAYYDPNSYISEQYKLLRNNILSYNYENPLQNIAVCSSLRKEGKSTTITNLAVTMAKVKGSEDKILLVDADFYASSLSKLLHIRCKVGLSDVLIGECELSDAIIKTRIDNLWFLHSGKKIHNPISVLDSAKMDEVVQSMREQFDFIFFDTPPIIAINDITVLGRQLDGVLMVIRSGHTAREIVERSIGVLNASKINIIGGVLTDNRYYIPDFIYKILGGSLSHYYYKSYYKRK
ncbi:MAG: CpsD/CapB family tyrosine-protein kinase [bacterium]|nr:CpsD/CapB family tyrosine-protein kinase [bacterium]